MIRASNLRLALENYSTTLHLEAYNSFRTFNKGVVSVLLRIVPASREINTNPHDKY
jgi:hypothetical protein